MDALKMARSKSQSSLNVQSQLCDAQTKLKQMEALVDNLRQQVTEAKEENELLEFQLLEHKHNPPVKEAMEKSTSTTDIDDFGEQIDLDADIGMPLDELKMRFTLLKHRRELRPDDRRVVAQMRRLSEQLEQVTKWEY